MFILYDPPNEDALWIPLHQRHQIPHLALRVAVGQELCQAAVPIESRPNVEFVQPRKRQREPGHEIDYVSSTPPRRRASPSRHVLELLTPEQRKEQHGRKDVTDVSPHLEVLALARKVCADEKKQRQRKAAKASEMSKRMDPPE